MLSGPFAFGREAAGLVGCEGLAFTGYGPAERDLNLGLLSRGDGIGWGGLPVDNAQRSVGVAGRRRGWRCAVAGSAR